jgi:hypothetical protein
MIINITNKTTIKDVQRRFSVGFPFLKIEFSNKQHEMGERTENGRWYDPSFRVLSIAKKPEPGWVIVQPWQKTGYIEELFKERFGLYPQIFRREGNYWVETAGTDVFTLEEQNSIARKVVDTSRRFSWRERDLLL